MERNPLKPLFLNMTKKKNNRQQFQLVEVSEWIDYNTKEKLGFYYTVLFPKLKFEKIKVGVKNANQLVSNEELEQTLKCQLNKS